jgi:hypothetical protein
VSIAYNDGYRDEPYCEEHPKYQWMRRPTRSCKFCWQLWDDQRAKDIKTLKDQLIHERVARKALRDSLTNLFNDKELEELL